MHKNKQFYFGIIEYKIKGVYIMEQYANVFAEHHEASGFVSNITNYSFTFTEYPKTKDAQPKSCIYMLSYFCEL